MLEKLQTAVRRFDSTVLSDLVEWARQDSLREVSGWLVLIRYLGILLPLGILALVAFVAYLKPLPPSKAYLGTGQAGTSQRVLSEKFARIFARYGVELVLVDTGGAIDNLRKLHDEGSPVNVSFVTAGSAVAGQFPNLVSLGSVQFSPVWLFYRGDPPAAGAPFGYLTGKKVSIGTEGTNTRKVLSRIWQLHSGTNLAGTEFLDLPHAEAAQQLIEGKIDAVCLVDGIDSPIVQKLLAVPGIKIFNFQLVDAYEKKLPFLDHVVVPRGSIDLQRIFPETDVKMLATSVTLLAERDTHPMIQWLFLIAAREIGRERDQFFAKSGTFPAYLDQTMPLSPIAERYYNYGVPMLAEYLPLWLAVLIDRLWVQLLAVFGVIVPLAFKIWGWRSVPSSKHLDDGFQDLRALDERGASISTRAEGDDVLAELDELGARMTGTWFDGGDIRSYYSFMGTLDRVRKSIAARIDTLPQ